MSRERGTNVQYVCGWQVLALLFIGRSVRQQHSLEPRHDLENTKKRLGALEAQVTAAVGLIVGRAFDV